LYLLTILYLFYESASLCINFEICCMSKDEFVIGEEVPVHRLQSKKLEIA